MEYKEWLETASSGEDELAALRLQADGFARQPRISLLLVVADPDEVWIKSTLDSVLAQIYPHLELRIFDTGAGRPHVREALREYAGKDGRIKLHHSPEESWGEAYDAALSAASGELVALLDAGDELAPEALFRVVELVQRDPADVIYTDEDLLDVSGTRSEPTFKPYWSPDLLLSTNYLGRLCVISRSVLEEAGGFEGGSEHALLLRVSEQSVRVLHLPGVLYHRRWLPARDDVGKGRNSASARAVEDALARRKERGEVETGLVEGSLRVVRSFRGRPRASVVVFAPEGMAEVPLVEALGRQTSYPLHEVIVAGVGREEHPSEDRVSHSFPARSLNLAAESAEGEMLIFLDGRAQITDSEWLTELVSQARRPGVGVVGCKVLNPSGGLRHGGSHVELNRLVGSPEEPVIEAGNLLPILDHPFNFMAASAECMAVRRRLFERVGGFDDESLPTAFYDLDLSLRLRERGLLNVYTPHAAVLCKGIRAVPGEEELEYVWRRWWKDLVQTLYYQCSPLHASPHAPEWGALVGGSY